MALAGAAALVCAALAPHAAYGALIFPNTTADEFGEGPGCGLREAIEAANTDGNFGGCSVADEGSDQIDLVAGATYPRTRTGIDDTNSNGDFDVVGEPLAIVGHGATIQGTDTSAGDRLFQKTGTGLLHLIRLTLRDGFTSGNGGAAVVDAGAIGITQSTITSNHAGLHGGAVETSGGTAVFTNATVSGNTANGDGGAVDSDDDASNTIFDNATVTQNIADADAAATAGRGGGVSLFRGMANASRTIIAGNADLTPATLAPDCFVESATGAAFGSGGYNLVGDTTGCGILVNTGDIRDASALLAPLASNGGDSQTHGLYPTSPAVDSADPAVCNAVDQRNFPRPVGPRCDIGAFEGTVPAPATAPTAPTAPAATPAKVCKKKKKKKKRRSASPAKKKKKKKKC